MSLEYGTPTVDTYLDRPQIDGAGEQSWITRAANFLVRYTRAEIGARLVRINNPDEYFVLVQGGTLQIEAGDEKVVAWNGSLAIVPPGESQITVLSSGEFTSVFTTRADDLAALAGNAAAYAEGVDVAPISDWPMPNGGYRLRVYTLADYDRPDTLMRLFRTRALMMNVFRPRMSPRDVTKLSPHSHEDFEQGSLCLVGDWVHHLRYPWTPDFTTWRPDQSVSVGSPSLTVIPNRVIHTSMNINEGGSRLVDIFAPPRADFARRVGLVCNADEYPMPPELAALPPLEKAD